MAQVVEPHFSDACAGEQTLEDLLQRTRAERRSYLIREDEIPVVADPCRFERELVRLPRGAVRA